MIFCRLGSGSAFQWHGSADPDPYKKVTNPEYWLEESASIPENPLSPRMTRYQKRMSTREVRVVRVVKTSTTLHLPSLWQFKARISIRFEEVATPICIFSSLWQQGYSPNVEDETSLLPTNFWLDLLMIPYSGAGPPPLLITW